jgi:hypothetical protein
MNEMIELKAKQTETHKRINKNPYSRMRNIFLESENDINNLRTFVKPTKENMEFMDDLMMFHKKHNSTITIQMR